MLPNRSNLTTNLTTRVQNLTHNNLLQPRPVWVLSLAVLCVHALMALSHGGPVAVPDIPAYLHVAQVLAGLGEPVNTQFHPGMGFLLTPLTLIGVDGSLLHTAALLLNGVIAAAAIPLTHRLAASLGASRRICLMACAVCAVFPVFAAGSRTAWPEPLLALLVLTITVNLTSETTRGLTAAGCVAALSVAVHPRAIVLCVVLVALMAVHRHRATARPLIIGMGIGMVMTAVSLVVTSTWLWPRVSASLNTTTLDQRLFVGVGQIAAVMGVSCGLAGFAAIAAWRSRNQTTGVAQAMMFNVLGVVAMAMLGGWVLGGGDRPDLVMYSRYVSPFALPLTVIGVCFVAQHLTRHALWVWTMLGWVTVTVGSGWMVEQSDRTYRRIMTLSNGWAWTFGSGQARTALLLTVGLASLGAALLMYYPRALQPVVALLIVASSLTTVLNHQKLAEIGDISQRQTQLHNAIPQTAACVSFDRDSTKVYLDWLYRLEQPQLSFTIISLDSEDRPCGKFVLAGDGALANCRGATVHKSDSDTGWALWAYPPRGCG